MARFKAVFATLYVAEHHSGADYALAIYTGGFLSVTSSSDAPFKVGDGVEVEDHGSIVSMVYLGASATGVFLAYWPTPGTKHVVFLSNHDNLHGRTETLDAVDYIAPDASLNLPADRAPAHRSRPIGSRT